MKSERTSSERIGSFKCPLDGWPLVAAFGLTLVCDRPGDALDGSVRLALDLLCAGTCRLVRGSSAARSARAVAVAPERYRR